MAFASLLLSVSAYACTAGSVSGLPDEEAEEIVTAVCAAAEERHVKGSLRVSVFADGRVVRVTLARIAEEGGAPIFARIESPSTAEALSSTSKLFDALERQTPVPRPATVGPPAVEADAPDANAPSPPRARGEHWYGWQTLLTDAAAVSFVALTVVSGQPPVFVPGALAYLYGAPIIHFAHGNSIGWASGGLRLFGPLLPAAMGAGIVPATAKSDDGTGWIAGAVLGYGIGAAAMVIIDAVVFAREPTEPRHLARLGTF